MYARAQGQLRSFNAGTPCFPELSRTNKGDGGEIAVMLRI